MEYKLWYQDSWYTKKIVPCGVSTDKLLKRKWIKPATFLQLQGSIGCIRDFESDIIYIREIQVREIENFQQSLF